MKIAPVSADLLIKVALIAASLGALWYIVNRAQTAAQTAVSDAADYLFNGPESAAQDYREAVALATADTDMNPFTNNPHNVNPADMIPAGYTVNQWGGIVPKTDGYTGSW